MGKGARFKKQRRDVPYNSERYEWVDVPNKGGSPCERAQLIDRQTGMVVMTMSLIVRSQNEIQ